MNKVLINKLYFFYAILIFANSMLVSLSFIPRIAVKLNKYRKSLFINKNIRIDKE